MTVKVFWHPFSAHPNSDSCWSVSTGPDGKIYAAACCEHLPGERVVVVRYNDEKDALDYLLEMDEVVEDPRNSGRATQCKIHYSFAPSPSDGVLYMATHLSGPPIDQPIYSPWLSWHDPKRCFRGSALVAFDTKKDEVLWWDTLFPKEGCRCLYLDEERSLLYALSYPRDHMFVYDLKKRTSRDLGRIGSVNSQVLFPDSRHRIWTTDDYGHLARYDPEKDRMERTPYTVPFNPSFQTGWHSVLYDAVESPDGDGIFAVTWIAQPRLMRIRPNEGEWGVVEDLGPATQDRDKTIPYDTFLDHCGGLVSAGDGFVYYVSSRWEASDIENGAGKNPEGVIWRLDPQTLERKEMGRLKRPDHPAQYVSRGAVDRNGDLFFGHVGPAPVGIFRVEITDNAKEKREKSKLRMWG